MDGKSKLEPLDPERIAFYRAIAAAPDDDLPRLILADWLDDHDECDRAEFIRLEVEKARIGTQCREPHPGATRGCGRCRFCQLEIETERFHENFALWDQICGPLPFGYAHTSRVAAPSDAGVERWPVLYTSRGFVSHLHIDSTPAYYHAGEIVQAFPCLEAVRLTDRVPWVGYPERGSDAPLIFGWWADVRQLNYEQDRLPRPLMMELNNDDRQVGTPPRYRDDLSGGCVVFYHRETAEDALSQAYIRWAKKMANRCETQSGEMP